MGTTAIKKAATNLTVLQGRLLTEPVLEVGAGCIRNLTAISRFASKEPVTERNSWGAGCGLLLITEKVALTRKCHMPYTVSQRNGRLWVCRGAGRCLPSLV